MFLMPAVKAMNVISDKWSRRTAGATQDYAAGVKSPKNDWQQKTIEAKDAQAAGVQAALANGSFEKGVAAAGSAKWQRKAAGVGAQRYGPGAQAAKGDYEQGFAPYSQVIQGVSLPPRGAKGDPRNYENVRLIGEALHNAKVGK
jgi:hypothetical protein